MNTSAWSPDGARLAFVSNRAESAPCLFENCAGYTNELYLMDAEGGDVERLTETPHDEDNPTWTPDGSRIAYSRIRDLRSDYELYVANEDGSCPRRVMETWARSCPTGTGPRTQLADLWTADGR
jgi:Tol biopolymer transport system component